MTFRAAAIVPPMVLSDPTPPGSAPMLIPGPSLGTATVPVTSVPIKLPSMTLELVRMSMPEEAFPEITVAGTGRGPADRRAARRDPGPLVGQHDAVCFVGQRDRARDVGADVIALDEIRRGVNSDSSPTVARNDVAGCGDGPSDQDPARALDQDAVAAIGQCLGSGHVGSDMVALHHVAGPHSRGTGFRCRCFPKSHCRRRPLSRRS